MGNKLVRNKIALIAVFQIHRKYFFFLFFFRFYMTECDAAQYVMVISIQVHFEANN